MLENGWAGRGSFAGIVPTHSMVLIQPSLRDLESSGGYPAVNCRAIVRDPFGIGDLKNRSRFAELHSLTVLSLCSVCYFASANNSA